jgi:hypothetical protein
MDLANTSRINRGNLKEEKELAMMCWKNLFKSRSDESEPFTLENFLEILENPRDIKPEAGDQPFKPFKTPCIKDIKPPQLKTEGLIVAAKAIEKLPSTDRANAFKATLEFARAAGLPKEDLASVLQQLSETIKNEDEDLASALRQEARNTTKGLPGEAGFLLDQLFTHDFLHDFLPDFDSILQQTRELPKSEKKAFLLQNLSNVHGVEITLPPLLRQEACDAMKGLPGEADLLYRQIDYFRFKKHITQKIIEVSAYKTVSDEEAKQLGLFGSHFIG